MPPLFPMKLREDCRISIRAFGSNRYKTRATGFRMTNLSALRQSSGPFYDRFEPLTSPSGRVFKNGTVAVGAARLGGTVETAIRTLNESIGVDGVLWI